MNQRVSAVDGNAYSIGFEMRLPNAWNGRFFYQAAARMPDEYDSYLACAPGYRLPLAAIANTFRRQAVRIGRHQRPTTPPAGTTASRRITAAMPPTSRASSACRA